MILMKSTAPGNCDRPLIEDSGRINFLLNMTFAVQHKDQKSMGGRLTDQLIKKNRLNFILRL